MVRFSNFRTLDPEVAHLAQELMDNAARQRSAFMSFVSVWMAFNGWMESVTDADNDFAMINALADNRRVTDTFEELVHGEDQFRRHVRAFALQWPVINVRDARKKLGRDVFSRLSHEELLRECQLHSVKFQPLGWNEGDLPTWAQTLRTIYAVRCNLFHGSKSPQNDRDRELVRSADHILRRFIGRSGCFEWES